MLKISMRRSAAILAVAAGALLGVSGTDSALAITPSGGDSAPPGAAVMVPAHQTTTPSGQRIVDLAAAQAGKPYVWGANGPERFDCSGLVQWTHKQAAIALPRTAHEQRTALPYIAKNEMRPGDLVFFANGGYTYHVGIYAGNNQMWAAPAPGDVVRLQSIWTNDYTVGRAW